MPKRLSKALLHSNKKRAHRNWMSNDQREKDNLYCSNNDGHLDHNPACSDERAPEDARALLALGLDRDIEQLGLLVPISEIMGGVPRAKVGQNKKKAT